jgi:hypothetical protein
MAVLNPAFAETLAVSVWRIVMYTLIWQSVMWRPGKLWFLIGVKNPLSIRPAATASQRAPLRRCAVRQIRDFSRAPGEDNIAGCSSVAEASNHGQAASSEYPSACTTGLRPITRLQSLTQIYNLLLT